MDDSYWFLIIFWVAYFIIHSLTASRVFKTFFYTRGVTQNGYRKVYVTISVIGLFAILLYSSTFDEPYLIPPGTGLRFLSLVLATFGVFVIRAAFRHYSMREFLGLSKEDRKGQLKKDGILSYVRHPLYSGTILVVAGFLLFIPKLSSLITTAVILLYLVVGIYLEEKKLEEEFGDQYKVYKKNVPALIPRIRDIF